eukprot:gene7191-10267_t
MPRKAPPPKGLVRGWLLLLAALADAARAPVSAVLVNWLFRTR